MTGFNAALPATGPKTSPGQKTPIWVRREADELTEQVLDGKLLSRIDAISHHKERHTKQGIRDMIERCISDDPMVRQSAASEFTDMGIMQEEMENAILDNAEAIVKWRADPNGEYTRAFLSEPQKDPVGHGIRYRLGSLEHAQAHQTSVVLSIDRKNPYGFRLTTVYPYINTDTAKATGRDISKELHECPSYQSAPADRQRRLDRAAGIQTRPPARPLPRTDGISTEPERQHATRYG